MISPTYSKILRTIGIVITALGLQGCKGAECGKYRQFVERSDVRANMERWADEAIFSRSFTDSDVRRGGMAGPGPSLGNLRPDLAEQLLPEYLRGHNVRLIGPDPAQPIMVLIGDQKYQGIMISRGEFDVDITKTRLNKDRLEAVEGRVGLLCLMPFE